jgi:hypothetical protein
MDYEPAESGNQHRQQVPHGLVTRSWLSEGILHGMSCRTQAARRAGVIGGRRAPGSVAAELLHRRKKPRFPLQRVVQKQKKVWRSHWEVLGRPGCEGTVSCARAAKEVGKTQDPVQRASDSPQCCSK